VKTYLDSGVLLAGWRGPDCDLALAIIEDPAREFYTSELVRLELLPEPTFLKQRLEIEFYNGHFKSVKGEEPLSAELGRFGGVIACKYGLAAVDALHIAAAIRQGAREFVTTEKEQKPIFRVNEILVRSMARLSAEYL
jgi:predicted nucleic acid-binding protein